MRPGGYSEYSRRGAHDSPAGVLADGLGRALAVAPLALGDDPGTATAAAAARAGGRGAALLRVLRQCGVRGYCGSAAVRPPSAVVWHCPSESPLCRARPSHGIGASVSAACCAVACSLQCAYHSIARPTSLPHASSAACASAGSKPIDATAATCAAQPCAERRCAQCRAEPARSVASVAGGFGAHRSLNGTESRCAASPPPT